MNAQNHKEGGGGCFRFLNLRIPDALFPRILVPRPCLEALQSLREVFHWWRKDRSVSWMSSTGPPMAERSDHARPRKKFVLFKGLSKARAIALTWVLRSH
jgi:hypothetical protein